MVINPAQEPSSAETGGFPEFATRNTTRVGGADPTADAASVALATYPTQGGVGSTGAATIVPADSWQLSLAAAPLTADPINTPILLSGADEVPQPTTAALTALSPQGIDKAGGAQAFAIGDVAVPGGLETTTFDGTDPADVADQVDVARAKITGVKDPAHLLVVSSSDAGLAMPAAAWAARSGDPILFADGDEVPAGTMKVIKRHPNAPVFVLGPSSAISDEALKKLGSATRVGAEDPVENAIEFAKFTSGDFGWNINDPGHGFAIATTDRPLDAAAAAPLASSGGSPGPAAAHRRSGHRAARAAELPQRYPAGLRGRPDPGRLQPRLDHRQQRGDLGAFPGAGRPVDQARSGQRGQGTSRRHPPRCGHHHHAGDRSGRSRRAGQSSTTTTPDAAALRTAPPATAPAGSRSAVEVGWRR